VPISASDFSHANSSKDLQAEKSRPLPLASLPAASRSNSVDGKSAPVGTAATPRIPPSRSKSTAPSPVAPQAGTPSSPKQRRGSISSAKLRKRALTADSDGLDSGVLTKRMFNPAANPGFRLFAYHGTDDAVRPNTDLDASRKLRIVSGSWDSLE
jgi:hypothetical protein